MGNVVVVGSQWGDEGKGKIVDWLSERADVVVRFQGGHNAGHTLNIDGKIFKLHLLPSGIVRPGKISVIGNGVVIDPWALLKEIDTLKKQNVKISPENLIIAENCPLILPIHSHSDNLSEKNRGNNKIGTTGRGIGPAYEDKVARRAIRVCDLRNFDILEQRLDSIAKHHNALRIAAKAEEISTKGLLWELKEIAEKILPYTKPAWMDLDFYKRSGKKILFEGAQGIMLDVDYGTYPYVTSSSTVAGSAFVGSGVGIGGINYVLGITKAYTTRVGSGPFPTELDDEIGTRFGKKGREFGTTTGRKRRCGWFDAVMVRQALKICGVNGIALTKLDVLDGMDRLKICVGYEYRGKKYEYLPADIDIQNGVSPIYEELEGWSENTMGARSFIDLPANAIKYIRRIEELISTPIAILSTSPERNDTILVRDPFMY